MPNTPELAEEEREAASARRAQRLTNLLRLAPRLTNLLRLAPLILALYFYGLTTAGLMSADEPRYAAVSREMVERGDYVTPRLFGKPWFEKPPLLYWMEGAALGVGLGAELSARLPVAMLAAAFLGFYFWILRREFGSAAAVYSTAILGSSAGWIAYGHAGVTDVPLAVFFSAAMLLGIRAWNRPGVPPEGIAPEGTRKPAMTLREAVLAGAMLGAAILAKGLVPLVLALPAARLARRELKRVVVVGAMCVAVAAPWYALCTLRNGAAFLDEFIWKHHFQRFSSDVLAHVQPFWFYVPVLLAILFPWTPLVATLADWNFFLDRRKRYLAAWALWGLVFFSAATNKLPGYLLPLLPACAALLGTRLAELKDARWLLGVCALLLMAIPVVGAILPAAMSSGLTRAAWPGFPWLVAVPVVGLAALAWWMERRGDRVAAVGTIVVGMAASVVFLVATALPIVDHQVSARFLFQQVKPRVDQVCYAQVNRAVEYGLNFYAHRELPRCEVEDRPIHIMMLGGRALPVQMDWERRR